MAATLTAAGLALLMLQRRVERARGRLARLGARVARVAPLATAGIVLGVGVGLTVRAVAALV
jgi:hypothetical protein